MKILRNILFFVLLFLVGFFLGILVANLVDAGKGQMLAGGAIVLGYGVIGAIIGLVTAILLSIVYKGKPSAIILCNKIMMILLIFLWGYFYLQYQQRMAEREKEKGQQIGSDLYKNESELSYDIMFTKF